MISNLIPAVALTEKPGVIARTDKGRSEGLPAPALGNFGPQVNDASGTSGTGMLPGDSGLVAESTEVHGHGTSEESSGTGDAVIVSTGAVQFETPSQPADSALRELLAMLDTGAPQPADEWRITEATRREEILKTFFRLIEGDASTGVEPISRAKAAKAIGQDYVTLWRWEKSYRSQGFNGLLPKTENCGRKSTFEKLGLTEEQVQEVIRDIKAINLDTNSVTASLRLYAQDDRFNCPPALADIILNPNRCSKHALPPSIRQAVKVNKNEKKAHRGPRALSLGGMWTPRKLDILPGDVFSADDTTPIWAWWVPWIKNEEYPFGVKLLQGQFIPVIDVASQMIVSFVMIARESSSYRAADIWHLFGHTFDTVGIPRLGFQLERGSWEANIIRGQEVEIGTDEVSITRRVGGLRQLPTTITPWHREKLGADFAFPSTLQTWTSFLPKSKSIEGWFNRSQNLEGTLWGCLGRDQMRAPFEKAKKQFQLCARKGQKDHDPRLHFLSGAEIAARVRSLIEYVNREPMEGEVFWGVPEQRFQQAVTEHPLGYLPDELQYLYKRDWTVLKITQGWARVRPTDPLSGRRFSLFYCNPQKFAELEGRDVAVYYDRENFESPAHIIDARSGEYLCAAEYHDRKGSFLDGGDTDGHEARKAWRNAVMSIYSTLAPRAPSRQLPPEIAARRAEAKTTAAIVDGRPAAPAPQQRKAQRQAMDDYGTNALINLPD